MVYLAQGDLQGARAAIRAAPAEVEPTASSPASATTGTFPGRSRRISSSCCCGCRRAPTTATAEHGGSSARRPIICVATERRRASMPTRPDWESRRRSRRLRTIRSGWCFSASRSPILGQKEKAIAGRSARRGARAGVARRLYGSLRPAPAGADLHRRRRAGQGDGPARVLAQDAVLSLARLAPDRSQLRAAQGQPAIPDD